MQDSFIKHFKNYKNKLDKMFKLIYKIHNIVITMWPSSSVGRAKD